MLNFGCDAGLDFYIDHVISKYGWNNVKRVSGTTNMDDGITITFPKHRFADSRTFKEDFVRFQKEMQKDISYSETEPRTGRVPWRPIWFLP